MIQGAGASILKIATVLVRRNLRQMNHKGWIAITPYDEIIMEVAEEHAEYWRIKLQYYMELAGKVSLGSDILKTDPCVVEDFWVH